MFNKESDELFSSVISQSSTTGLFAAYFSLRQAIIMGESFKNFTGCTGDKNVVLNCIRNLNSNKFVEALDKGMYFNEVIDEKIFDDLPVRLAMKGDFNRKPIMIGHTTNELSNKCADLPPGQYGTPEQYQKLLPGSFADMSKIFGDDKVFNEFIDKIFNQYPPSKCDNNPQRACCRLLDNLVNDFLVRCPARRLARALRYDESMPDIFFFNFDQAISCPDLVKLGAFHTSDITWVFGAEGSYYESKIVPNCTWSSDEREFSSKVIDRWQNFATTFRPAPEWQPYDRPHYYYQNLAVGQKFYLAQFVASESSCDFWDGIEVEYSRREFPDDTPTQDTKHDTDREPYIAPGNVVMTSWIFFLAIGTVFTFGCACAWCLSGIVGCFGRKIDIQYNILTDYEESEDL